MLSDLDSPPYIRISDERAMVDNRTITEELPAVLTVAETARFLRIGRSKMYEVLRQGSIPHVRLGKQIRVPRDELLAWLSSGGLRTERIQDDDDGDL